jgi:hypothetical protein
VKHGIDAAGPFLGQPSPATIAHADSAIAHRAGADEIDIGAVVVRRPPT